MRLLSPPGPSTPKYLLCVYHSPNRLILFLLIVASCSESLHSSRVHALY